MAMNVFAQRKDFYFKYAPKDRVFSVYAGYVRETLNISWKKPRGFVDLRATEVWAPARKTVASFSGVTLQSKNRDCLILYPMMELITPKWWEASSQKYGELAFLREQVVIDMGDSLKSCVSVDENDPNKSDFGGRLTILAGDETPMNADTVFVLKIPLQIPYKSKYIYYTGIYAYKRGRPPMIFRCLFTEKGKRKESKYLSRFYKTICYHGDGWSIDKEKFNVP